MSELRHARHFTLEEANSLLPKIIPKLLKIQDALERFREQQKHAKEALARGITNGKKHMLKEKDALDEIGELTLNIEEMGCVIKDYKSGLIDFPAIYNGREIYLCWKLGENEITAWHEIDEGFIGRKPISELKTEH